MQEYKYAFDLEENIYSLTSAFDSYKLSNDEINKLRNNSALDEINKEIEKELVYDSVYIYFAPREFIEQFKLSNEEKLKLYKSIEKIKFTEITPENIKDISFILYHILKLKIVAESDVQAYEMPISNYWQFIPFNERINFGIDNILTRQNETKYTQQGLNHHISIDTQEKLSLSDEVTDFSTQGENKILSNFYNGLADFGFNRAEQINTTYNNTQENAFFCTPLGQQEENIIPFPKIDTNEDGKVDTDTKKILEEALNLLNKEVNLTLDPTIPREKKVVCADVPAIVYEKCGIDMPSKIAEAQQKALFKIDNTTIDYLKSKNLNTKKLDFIRTLENKEYSRKELIKILQKKNFTNEEILLILDPEHTYTNKPLYKCTTVSPENDNSLTSRVANWYQFFVDKKLLHSGYNLTRLVM